VKESLASATACFGGRVAAEPRARQIRFEFALLVALTVVAGTGRNVSSLPMASGASAACTKAKAAAQAASAARRKPR
jgi:hypothetical protein